VTTSAHPTPARRPRRARTEKTRQVDPERSKAALLDAALEEFAAHGFAGARVRDIAERAGVSKDLVNYYFDSKEGLYTAVQRAWLDREDRFADPGLPLAELLVRYLHDALNDPRPMRLLAWRGLTTGPAEAPPDAAPAEDLTSTIRRQHAGELAEDLDPATIRLVLLAAVAAPVVFPTMAARLLGTDPGTPGFESRYAQGLRALVDHLAPSDHGSRRQTGSTDA